MYFFGAQKSVMNCPREQLAKEHHKALIASIIVGAFLNEINSKFAHKIIIKP